MQVGVNDDEEKLCQHPGCTQIDLLTAKCSNCNKRFCSEHIGSSAHQCKNVTNTMVASCPLCNRVVSPEYPGQSVDEAVNRHIDRGCRPVPQSGEGATLSGGGRRLGGKGTCMFEHCPALWSVTCPGCRKRFCATHGIPSSLHACPHPQDQTVKRSGVVTTSKTSPTSTSPKPENLTSLLMQPKNTIKTALGKPTERLEDMVVPLVCVLLPNHSQKTTSSLSYEPILPFFYHVNKSLGVGRLVDLLVDEAANASAAVDKARSQRWNLFVIPTPVPTDASASMYPPVTLSLLVRQSPLLKCSARQACFVIITTLDTLPQEVLEACASANSTINTKEGKSDCSSM